MKIGRATKLRLRRRIKRQKKSVNQLTSQADKHFEKHFFGRYARLWAVRRFISVWITLLLILIGTTVVHTWQLRSYYKEFRPVAGGNFIEGSVGTFTGANPLFAVSSVDATVSKLVFSSLFTYNARNELVGDLAEKFTVDERGTTYDVTLRPGLRWQDGKPLTAADVLFTYQTIQNPDTRSPLLTSWSGIKVSSPDDRRIVFVLPSALISFPYSLTNGIVPKHILSTVPPAQLRASDFNTKSPVGSGPFLFSDIEIIAVNPEMRVERIALSSNPNYHISPPRLNRFVVQTFTTKELLEKSFYAGELTAAVGINELKDELKENGSISAHPVSLTSGEYVFFKTTAPILSDVAVRRALRFAIDPGLIMRELGYPLQPLRGPLLAGQLGYDPALAQPKPDLEQSKSLLNSAGWIEGTDGSRSKGTQKLQLRLLTDTNDTGRKTAEVLVKQWRRIGIEVQVDTPNKEDLATRIAAHNYDALLYGISIGIDPDVFAYWHSSQSGTPGQPNLNFSEYKSATADSALEAGRTRSDPQIRQVKYRPFLEAWLNDAPAVALYQPRFLYVIRSPLEGFEPKALNSEIDRLNNVHNWTIREAKTNK